MPNYQGMADLDAGDVVGPSDMDIIRENIEWLAGLQSGGVTLSTIAAGLHLTGISKAAFGEYTGDGTGNAGSGGQSVGTNDADGNSFQPDVVIIVQQVNASPSMYVRGYIDLSGTSSGITITTTGFDATDGGGTLDQDPNKNGRDYAYLAVKL